MGVRVCGCADGVAQSLKPSADACWGEQAWVSVSFPGQAKIVDGAAGEAELGVGGDDEPGPAIGLYGCAHGGGGPAEGVLGEAVGVLDVEAA